MYKPDNTQASAQFALNPFQPLSIPLNVDRSGAGRRVTELEGDFLFVEECDWPVGIVLVDQTTDIARCIPAYPGLLLRATFKGVTLVHNQISGSSDNVPQLKLTIGKGAVERSNDSAFPLASNYSPVNPTTNTALSQIGTIPVPPGARVLSGLHITGVGTTVTEATLSNFNAIGNVWQGGNQPGYGIASQALYTLTGRIFGTRYAVESPVPIMLPSNAAFIQYSITGTGLARPEVIAPFSG